MKEGDFSAALSGELGIYLGIQPGRISTLRKKSSSDPDILLSEIITEWLNNDSEKSWKKLATALRQCNYSLIAEKIDPQEGIHEMKFFFFFLSVRYNDSLNTFLPP